MWKDIRTKALALVVLAVALSFGTNAQAACINWSDARGVIAKNGLLKPGAVRKRAMRRGGEVVSINLCRKGGRYIYRLTVIGKKNRVRDIVVDAKSGVQSSSRSSRKSGKKSGKKTGGKRSSRSKKMEDRIIRRVRRNLRRYGIDYY